MKERPILFAAPMVRALLAGTKTQTRRVVRIPGSDGTGTHCYPTPEHSQMLIDGSAEFSFDGGFDQDVRSVRCPYGVPGDRLWVRETHSLWADQKTRDYLLDTRDDHAHLPAVYAANHPGCSSLDAGGGKHWRPSIFMRRSLSRITLEVTDVRIERLQDISEEDARAEGVQLGISKPCTVNGEPGVVSFFDPNAAYAYLWNQINGIGAWSANPWVWAVSFRVMS